MAVLNFPDPTSQTPANTFSPTSTPNATSNGVTYVWTNGSWSIAGVSNGGFLDKDEADSYYVEQSGDNMTGDLTLGTDKITLDATNGYGYFGDDPAERVSIYGTDGYLVIRNDSDGFGGDPAGVIGIYRGGTAVENETVSIRSDGNANFAGSVVSSDGTAGQAALLSTGLIRSYQQSQDGSNYFFLGSGGPGDSEKFSVKCDGSASFASGGVQFGDSGDYGSWMYLDRPSSTGVYITRPSSSELGFTGDSTDIANNTAKIKFDVVNGSAHFGGNVTSDGTIGFNLEPDNDANYVTTTDAEGNESRVYNGPTLDVKERLQNLISRMDALEADEISDDAASNALLTLIGSLTARIDARDAVIADLTTRIQTLEGGNN